MSSQTADNDVFWFYEEKGERKGSFDPDQIREMVKAGKITYGTPVWRKGFPEWMKAENTELVQLLNEVAPPPLTGSQINNTVVWVLAFAPIIGGILEYMVAYSMYNSDYKAEEAVLSGQFFYITVALNIALSFWDEKILTKAGHDTNRFKGWVWLVPVYLYKRADALNHNMAYFIVWIVTFLALLFNL